MLQIQEMRMDSPDYVLHFSLLFPGSFRKNLGSFHKKGSLHFILSWGREQVGTPQQGALPALPSRADSGSQGIGKEAPEWKPVVIFHSLAAYIPSC